MTGTDASEPGSLLILGPTQSWTRVIRTTQPWSDYRVTAYVRNADDDAIGLVFVPRRRRQPLPLRDGRRTSSRRLVRVVSGVHTNLPGRGQHHCGRGSAHGARRGDRTPRLRVYVDREPILAAANFSLVVRRYRSVLLGQREGALLLRHHRR